MNKDEKILEEYFGKKQPFQVPEGYFDDFASKLMAQLPEKDARVIKMQPTLWQRFRPYAVAASVVAVIFSVGLYISLDDRLSVNSKSHSVAKTEYNNSYSAFDAAADYTMLDNEEIYSYIADSY